MGSESLLDPSHGSPAGARPGSAGGPLLGKNGNNCAPADQAWFLEPPTWTRRDRLALRTWLWDGSTIEELRRCGRVRIASSLQVVKTPNGVDTRGLARCRSVWACPMCSVGIRAARGVEITGAIEVHLAGDGGVGFGTFTVPHGISDALKETYSAVASAWHSVNVDKSVRKFRKACGYWGFCRTCEVTHGPAGWHPHAHWLDFWDRPLTLVEQAEYSALLLRAWQAAVVRLGLERPSDRYGLRYLRTVGNGEGLGDYLVKCDPKWAGFELTAVSTKQARGESKGPFDLLWLARNRPDYGTWAWLWREYEQGTRGRRMLGWSKGLRERIGVLPDDPDPEAVGGQILARVLAEDHAALSCAGVWHRSQWAIEQAALDGGQIGVDDCVRALLGLAPRVELAVQLGSPQLQLQGMSAAEEVGF